MSNDAGSRCSQCNAVLKPGAKFCASCGTPVPQRRPGDCPSCGAELRETAKFCPSCGTPVSPAAKPSAPVSQDSPAFQPAPAPLPEQANQPQPRKKSGCLKGCLISAVIAVCLLALFVVARMFGDDRISAVRLSKLASSANTGVPALPTKGPGSSFTFATFDNNRFGFSVGIPNHWESTINDNSLIFSGKQGSEDFFTTINFQVIVKGSTTLKDQCDGLIKQLSTAKNFKLLGNKTGELRGQPAAFMVTKYQAPDSQEWFLQAQVVAERGPYYYWIGYTAPARLAKTYSFVMEHAMASFRFTEIAQPSQTRSGQPNQGDLKAQLKDLEKSWNELADAFREAFGKKKKK